jgi:hypothetical protein
MTKNKPPVVYGTLDTALLVNLADQHCMNCQLKWLYHAVNGIQLGAGGGCEISLACLHRQAPMKITRAPSIEPPPPPAIGRTVLELVRPYQRAIEPRRD